MEVQSLQQTWVLLERAFDDKVDVVFSNIFTDLLAACPGPSLSHCCLCCSASLDKLIFGQEYHQQQLYSA